ncbi:unnamed protein product [Candida verbasci]|uniref:Enolase-phosphatase E1 n=1 Tax=Candida verbasci TaxID=1227364 RepID=A0A9W4X927_9ASCO|nr:unnamed protein product [Candida verbasci]
MAIDTVIVDIEGTVCPITFVKDTLFPYFIKKLPSYLENIQFPLNSSSSDPIVEILLKLPNEIRVNSQSTFNHFKSLVDQDIKDPILKSLQGLIWNQGYKNGELKAPIYPDSIKFIQDYKNKIYVYSSGSVNAQKLLFGYVEDNGNSIDLNKYLSGYFDITTSGYKNQPQSYKNILKDINKDGSSVLFLSDNINEVKAAIEAGMNCHIVIRDGNAPISNEDKSNYQVIYALSELNI